MSALDDLLSEVVDEALGKVSQSLSRTGGLQFPDDLGSNKIVFQVKTRTRTSTKYRTDVQNGATIALPIPSNLSTGYGASYSQEGIGVLGQAARDFVAGGGGLQSAAEKLKSGELADVLVGQAKAIAAQASVESAALIGGLVGGAAGVGVGAAAAGATRGALAGAGVAVNPHLAVLFEGVGFRNHSFQYKFSPRNQGESSALRNIIKVFKFAMHPEEKDLAFFTYPDEFDITFPSNELFLFKIGTSVLTDFQINYNPDGGSHFHQNGAPVSVALSLNFTELDVLTKAEIDEGR